MMIQVSYVSWQRLETTMRKAQHKTFGFFLLQEQGPGVSSVAEGVWFLRASVIG